MDTGEHIAIEEPFTEANRRYRQLQEKLYRIANIAVQHTKVIHRTYHKQVYGGWKACRRSICRHTQMMMLTENLDMD